jgi:phosphotriesterase-related protein
LVDIRSYWNPPTEVATLAAASAPFSERLIGVNRRNPFFSRDNLVLDDVECAEEELKEFYNLGGRTIVDLTPPDIGRDVLALASLARRTGLNIIAGSGHYVQISHPSSVASESVDDVAQRLMAELSDGIGETGIRAGIIGELGTSNPLHPDEVKVLRAAAQAQKECAVPVAIHLSPPPRDGRWLGHDVLDVFESEGVAPSNVLLGHLDNALGPGEVFEEAISHQCELAARGCFLGYDGCGKDHYFPSGSRAAYPSFWCPSDRERARAVWALAERGAIGQLLLSQDICFKIDLFRNGGFGYGHILRTFAKNLRDYGLSSTEIETILTEHPRRFLSRAGH